MAPDVAGSLGDFIDAVRHMREDWRVPEHKRLWFRGENQDFGENCLRPGLYRKSSERHLKTVPALLEIERDLFATFRRCSSQLGEYRTQDLFESYLLMQHHGAPTRLLDWSDGSLMALHFALKDRDGVAGDAIVYVLETTGLRDRLRTHDECEQQTGAKHSAGDLALRYLPALPDDVALHHLPQVPMLFSFPHLTRRVAAQRSQFLIFGSDPSWLSHQLSDPDPCIRAIRIEAESIRGVRAELWECGITESVLFPDLDGLGRGLKQLWQDRR